MRQLDSKNPPQLPIKNALQVSGKEFAAGLKTFRARKLLPRALLSFEGGYLMIEAGDRMGAMHATGEWNGRASFSSDVLIALAKVPPHGDFFEITYEKSKLRIGHLTVGCDWEIVSAPFLKKVTSPGVLDLLAMDRTLPRTEIHGTGLAKQIRSARSQLARNLSKAAKLLAEVEITEDDLWELVEERIITRLEARSGDGSTSE